MITSKRCKAIMVPAFDGEQPYLHQLYFGQNNTLNLYSKPSSFDFVDKFQHLHIVLWDGVILPGDLRFDLEKNSIGTAFASEVKYYNNNPHQFKKVVASTDPELGLYKVSFGFLNKYANLFHTKNKIEFINVIFEKDGILCPAELVGGERCDGACQGACDYVDNFKVKVDKGNYITIKKAEILHDIINQNPELKNELNSLLYTVYKKGISQGQNPTTESFHEWIKTVI